MKAVIQAIPTYVMSVFKLPIMAVINDLNKFCSKFWWNQDFDKASIHWKKWEKMSRAKSEGGLGFKEINCFNKALLANQAWRALKNLQALWVRIMKAIHYPYTNFLDAKKGASPS